VLTDKVPFIRNFLTTHYDAEAVLERKDVLYRCFYVKISLGGSSTEGF